LKKLIDFTKLELGGTLGEPDVETFMEGIKKVEAHLTDLKKTEARSYRLTQYNRQPSRESFFTPIKNHLECCVCMDVPKTGRWISNNSKC